MFVFLISGFTEQRQLEKTRTSTMTQRSKNCRPAILIGTSLLTVGKPSGSVFKTCLVSSKFPHYKFAGIEWSCVGHCSIYNCL